MPIIDWNPRPAGKDPYLSQPIASALTDDEGKPLEHPDDRGVPVCACGYDRSKMATKYRCPFAVGRIESCERWLVCTPSKYGRVIKTYDSTDFKLFGPVPYRSELWKDIYKDRTSTERADNRVPDDYGLQHLSCRNGSKHFFFFFAVMAATDVHLDACRKTSPT